MRNRSQILRSDGYTLIETLAALAVFLSVVIPLMASLGIFMAANSADDLRYALIEAQTEIANSCLHKDFNDASRTLRHGILLQRTGKRLSSAIIIEVNVLKAANHRKVLHLERVCNP